jgi:hypothetical protein
MQYVTRGSVHETCNHAKTRIVLFNNAVANAFKRATGAYQYSHVFLEYALLQNFNE